LKLGTCILMEEQTKPGSLEAAMSDVEEFRAEIHPRLVGELTALHNGDHNRDWRCGRPRTR
jgi:hypothetical protein